MAAGVDDEVISIVNILLQVGERVVEVSRDQVMTRIWDRPGSPLASFRSQYEGKRLAEIRNDSTIASAIGSVEQAFADGTGSYTEYVSYNNDINVVRTYSLRVLPCHPDKDFVFLVIDNISRGKAEMLVEDRWKMALDASQQGVWDVNMDEKTIFFSDKWSELFGYEAREISTISEWSEKVYPEDRAVAEMKMQEYMDGIASFYSAELRYRCKDGSYKWILSRGVAISRKPDGAISRFIGTHADITVHKQAEEELRQAKETFANSFHYSGAGKVLIAPGGKWLEVNDVLCSLTGYSREELLQLHYRDITFPDDVDLDAGLIQQLITKEISSYSIEKRYVSKDRRVLDTVITVSLVWGSDNQPRYFVCDVVDMTRQKEISDELRRKNAALETTSVNLRTKISQLEELNNIIAHNLRGSAGNIKMLSDESGLFENNEALSMIHTASVSLLDTLETMVEVARIKLDKDAAYDVCRVRDLVNGIVQQLQAVIYQDKIKLELILEVEEISYPRMYLESILYNLISNAIKYRRRDIQPEIQILTRMVDRRVQLSVKDNGLGIDLERYGGKMFKLNQVFHRGFDSKGVGLFITKTQIESLGGTIEVKSKPDEGCNFIVTL